MKVNSSTPTCTGIDVETNMPFLSPQLEKLNGRDDLFKYWEKTKPRPLSSHDEL
jgi:hypothetical protein